LLHVDAHLDNFVFLERNTTPELVIFDWQGVARGLCVVDLALFLSGATVERRREHEPRLLAQYHAGLIAHRITGYSFPQLLDDYRTAILRWWIGTINGLGSSYAASWTGRQAEVARQSVIRWCAAVNDHQLVEIG
jgi:thiamine kinase-like enzyme